jgi:valyl-tRNA synthetase
LIEVVRGARNLRAEKRLKPGEFVEAFLIAPDERVRAAFEDRRELIEALARLRPLTVGPDEADAPKAGVAKAVLAEATLALRLPDVDSEAERARIRAEMDQLEAYVSRQGEQLAKAKASGRAPEKVIRDMEEKVEAARARLEGLSRSLEELGT